VRQNWGNRADRPRGLLTCLSPLRDPALGAAVSTLDRLIHAPLGFALGFDLTALARLKTPQGGA